MGKGAALRAFALLVLAGVATGEPDDALHRGLVELRVRSLASTLDGTQVRAKWCAAWALSRLGTDGEDILVACLECGDAPTRVAALRGLGYLSAPNGRVMEALLRALPRSRDPMEQDLIRWGLLRFAADDPAQEQLLVACAEGNGPLTREAGFRGLARACPSEVAAAILVAGLGDRNESIRHLALQVIANQDWVWPPFARSHLTEQDPVGARWKQFWTEARFAGLRAKALPVLLRLARDNGAWGQSRAINALRRPAEPPAECVETLLHVFRDPNAVAEVRWRAAAGLVDLIGRGRAPLALLSEMLARYDPTIEVEDMGWPQIEQRLERHQEATAVLGAAVRLAQDLGPRARPVVPALKALFEEGRATDPVAVAGLLARLQEASDVMLAYLVQVYAGLKPGADEERTALEGYLRANPRVMPLLASVVQDGMKVRLSYHHRELSQADAIPALGLFPERKEDVARLLRAAPLQSGLAEYRAVAVLHRLGLTDARDRLTLLALMKQNLRLDAARLLRSIDPEAEVPKEPILEWLGRGDSAAAKLLLEMQADLTLADKPTLLAAVAHSHYCPEPYQVFGLLEEQDEETLAALGAGLASTSSSTRIAAGQVLAALTPPSRPAVRKMLDMARNAEMSDEDEHTWCVTLPILEALAADPERAALAREILEGDAGQDLDFAVAALEVVARDAPATGDLRARLLARGWKDRYLRPLSEGTLCDRRLLQYLPPLLLDSTRRPFTMNRAAPAMAVLCRMLQTDQERAALAAELQAVLLQGPSRTQALQALGELGAQARSALPAVTSLAADPDWAPLAQEVLDKIGK